MKINLIKDLPQYDGVLSPVCRELTARGHQVVWTQTNPSPDSDMDAYLAVQDVAYRGPRTGEGIRFFINHGSSCIKTWGLNFDLDVFIAPTEYWATRAVEKRDEYGQDYVVTEPLGWPKVDDILDRESDVESREKLFNLLRLQEGEPIVCFYPTYAKAQNFNQDWGRKYLIRDVVNKLRFLTPNFIVIPHQMDDTKEFDNLGVKVYKGRDKLAKTLTPMADVIVSDTSGLAFECCATNQPVVLMAGEEPPRIEGVGDIVDFGPHATVDTVEPIVKAFLKNPKWYTMQRRIWRDRVLGPCDGTATKLVVDHMEVVVNAR